MGPPIRRQAPYFACDAWNDRENPSRDLRACGLLSLPVWAVVAGNPSIRGIAEPP